MSYKSIFAIVAVKDLWEIKQMDIRIVYFYGDIEEEIYVQQQTEFINAIFPNYSCLLNKTLMIQGKDFVFGTKLLPNF